MNMREEVRNMERVTNDYSKIFTEVDEIFAHLPEELLSKVPAKIKKEVKANKDTNYEFEYDEDKELKNQKIYEQTKDFIALIYILYICKKDEKQRLLKICKENDLKKEKEKEGKYKTEDLFKNKIQKSENTEETSLQEIKKRGFFGKIIDKIKNIFKK